MTKTCFQEVQECEWLYGNCISLYDAENIARQADASLASKDAEIAQMYAAAGEAQAERDAARDERDTLVAEVARLREEVAALTASSTPGLLDLVSRIRFAVGDNGKRMQPELVEYLKALLKDADRYRWMRRSLYWDGHAWWIPDLWVSSPDVRSLSQSDDVPYPTDTEIDASVDHAIATDARKKG